MQIIIFISAFSYSDNCCKNFMLIFENKKLFHRPESDFRKQIHIWAVPKIRKSYCKIFIVVLYCEWNQIFHFAFWFQTFFRTAMEQHHSKFDYLQIIMSNKIFGINLQLSWNKHVFGQLRIFLFKCVMLPISNSVKLSWNKAMFEN